MSASTEKLLEQIAECEELLVQSRSTNDTQKTVQTEQRLRTLRASLATATAALNENKQLLKS